MKDALEKAGLQLPHQVKIFNEDAIGLYMQLIGNGWRPAPSTTLGYIDFMAPSGELSSYRLRLDGRGTWYMTASVSIRPAPPAPPMQPAG